VFVKGEVTETGLKGVAEAILGTMSALR